MKDRDNYFLSEVLYDDDGSLSGYVQLEDLVGATVSELEKCIKMMLRDLKKSKRILTPKDFHKKSCKRCSSSSTECTTKAKPPRASICPKNAR